MSLVIFLNIWNTVIMKRFQAGGIGDVAEGVISGPSGTAPHLKISSLGDGEMAGPLLGMGGELVLRRQKNWV